MGTFRKLYASEIECRVATVKQPDKEGNDGGVSILLYKDARVDMRLLDEVFGTFGWKREHQTIDGRLYCTISVFNEKTGEWVSKQDVGVESYTEKEKGQASDSFKRAGFNWGIGRELYTAPFIWINLNKNEWRDTPSGGKQPKVRFEVTDIAYDGENIIGLILKDDSGMRRFTFGDFNKTIRDKALAELSLCKSRDEVNVVWNNYKDLKTDNIFVVAVTEKGKELTSSK